MQHTTPRSVIGDDERPAFRSLRRPILTLSSAKACGLTSSMTTAGAQAFSNFYDSTEMFFLTPAGPGGGEKMAQITCALGAPRQLSAHEADYENKVVVLVVANTPQGLTERIKFHPHSVLDGLHDRLQLALVVRLLLRFLSQEISGPAGERGHMPEWLWDACAVIVHGVVLRDPRHRAELLEMSCLRVEHGLAKGKGALIEQGELGEALEACGRFEEAAAQYAEVANGEKMARGGAHEQAGICYVNAGVAYRRGGKLLEAEKQYGLALRCFFDASPTGCIFHVRSVLDSLVNALDHITQKPNGESASTVRAADGTVTFEGAAHAAFLSGQALLSRAGDDNYQTREQKGFAKTLLSKDAFKDANRAIVRVAQAGPDPIDIRMALCQCLKTNLVATFNTGNEGNAGDAVDIVDGLQQQTLREDSEAARRQLLEKDENKNLVGKHVRIEGLQSRADCNGASGVALSYLEERGRYAVEIRSTGERMALKRENLVLLSWDHKKA